MSSPAMIRENFCTPTGQTEDFVRQKVVRQTFSLPSDGKWMGTDIISMTRYGTLLYP